MSNKESANSPPAQQSITASEALYGFMGWLTTRPEPLILSGNHDAAPVPPLIDEYCRVNGLPPPREGIYPKNLTSPSP